MGPRAEARERPRKRGEEQSGRKARHPKRRQVLFSQENNERQREEITVSKFFKN